MERFFWQPGLDWAGRLKQEEWGGVGVEGAEWPGGQRPLVYSEPFPLLIPSPLLTLTHQAAPVAEVGKGSGETGWAHPKAHGTQPHIGSRSCSPQR